MLRRNNKPLPMLTFTRKLRIVCLLLTTSKYVASQTDGPDVVSVPLNPVLSMVYSLQSVMIKLFRKDLVHYKSSLGRPILLQKCFLKRSWKGKQFQTLRPPMALWQLPYKRPTITPRFTIPDMQVILDAISANSGLTITADYIAKERFTEKKVKLIGKGQVVTDNVLFFAYDRTKVTTEQIKIA